MNVVQTTKKNLDSLLEQVSKDLEGGTRQNEAAPLFGDWDIAVVNRLSSKQQAECIKILQEDSAVHIPSAHRGLVMVSKAAFAKSSGKIIGLAVLKADRPAYATKIAGSSGSSIEKGALEVGYVAVLPDFRGMGLGSELLSNLLWESDRALFATTSSPAMKKLLEAQGFRRTGKAWPGRAAKLSLWQRGSGAATFGKTSPP